MNPGSEPKAIRVAALESRTDEIRTRKELLRRRPVPLRQTRLPLQLAPCRSPRNGPLPTRHVRKPPSQNRPLRRQRPPLRKPPESQDAATKKPPCRAAEN